MTGDQTMLRPSPEDPTDTLSHEDVRARLLAGQPIEFSAPPANAVESPEARAARTIPAAWLEELAARPARVVLVPVTIANALIDGPLDLQYATFDYEVSITNGEFTGAIDLSFATFKRRATFDDTRFYKPIRLRAAHAQGDLFLRRAPFDDGTLFTDTRVEHLFDASEASFGAVWFDGLLAARNLNFAGAHFGVESARPGQFHAPTGQGNRLLHRE